jgi:hypothetical protein
MRNEHVLKISDVQQFRQRLLNSKSIAIVGAGICGLSVAYALQKLGLEVSIFDQDQKKGSSYHQHGWFHTGNLYFMNENSNILAHFKRNETLIDMLGMDFNIRSKIQPWFDNKKITFHVRNSPSQIKRLISPWSHRVRRGILRQEGKYTNSLINTTLSYNRRSFEKSQFGKNYFPFESTDKVMNSQFIVQSFENFLFSKNIKTFNEVVSRLDKNGLKSVINGNKEFDMILLCAGDGITKLCDVKMNSVYSMIGVFKKQISDQNFVIIDKNSENTLNCMNHYQNNKNIISVFGDGQNFSCSPNKEEVNLFSEKIKSFSGSKPDYIYFGKKSELQRDLTGRNYLPYLKSISDNVYAITPGKFSNFPSVIKMIYSCFDLTPQYENKSNWNPIYLEQ